MSEAERLDVLLSAAMDGALGPEERAELDRLLAADESRAARAGELAGVDAALRGLARDTPEETIDTERRLAVLYQGIEGRLGLAGEALERPASAGRPIAGRVSVAKPREWRRRTLLPVVSAAAAAAAAAALYLLWPDGSLPTSPIEDERLAIESADGPDRAGVESMSRVRPEQGAGSLAESEALLDAIDYVIYSEELEGFGPITGEDLEIIEQLELLDYLVARDAEARG